jgi:hypothetical protein
VKELVIGGRDLHESVGCRRGESVVAEDHSRSIVWMRLDTWMRV